MTDTRADFEKTSVWLVWKNHSWDAPELLSIFSSEEDADAYVASRDTPHRFSADEWPIDKPPAVTNSVTIGP